MSQPVLVVGTEAVDYLPYYTVKDGEYRGLINGKQIRLYENGTLKGLLAQVLLGRVDGAYVNIAVAAYHLNHVLHQPDALIFNAQ